MSSEYLDDFIFKREIDYARRKYWPSMKSYSLDFYKGYILDHMVMVANRNNTSLSSFQIKAINSITVEEVEMFGHKITRTNMTHSYNGITHLNMAIRDNRHIPWIVPVFPDKLTPSVSMLAIKKIAVNGLVFEMHGASAEYWNMDPLYGEKPRTIIGWALELDIILAEAVLREITHPYVRSFVVDSFFKAVAIMGYLMPITYKDALFADAIWSYKQRFPKKPIPPIKQEIEFVPLTVDEWSNRGYYITK